MTAKPWLLFAGLILGVSILCSLLYLNLAPGLQRAVANPPDTEDPFLLAQYYFNYGDNADGYYDIKKAREYYNAAIKEDPQGHDLSWYQLGRIDFLEGHFDAAIYKFNKQLEYFGDAVPNVYYMLGLTYGYKARSEGDSEVWSEAERYFKIYIEKDPASSWAKVDLAWVYFSEGKFESMIPVLESGLERDPDNPWLQNMYGLALFNTGEIAEAKVQFLKAKDNLDNLTADDWGKIYPGNHPILWQQGLDEFRLVVQKNLDLVTSD